MKRAVILLLLGAILALLAHPVLGQSTANNTETTSRTESEHAVKGEVTEERDPTGEPERSGKGELAREPKYAEQSEHAGEPEHADEPERDNSQHDTEPDDESDSAPFMIVIQHGNGRRCGGSLVSLRTALTSAWCVRGQHGGDPRELWALAPAVPPARPVMRRVARVALAAGADSDSPPPHLEPAWIGATLDIAVLELEAPFGGDARSRPILMATQPEDCESSTMCHVVRSLGHEPRLRIVDAAIVPGERCSAVARGWPGLRDTSMCLAGPELCLTDRGAGVVCDGKLCGVLSRSARDVNATGVAATTTADGAVVNDTCGDVHVAQSVAQWRHFLHCAHTLRACGSGGECAQLCSERQLMVIKTDEDRGAEGGGGSSDVAGSGGGSGDVAGGGSGGVVKGTDESDAAKSVPVYMAHREEPDTDVTDTYVTETVTRTSLLHEPTDALVPDTTSSGLPEETYKISKPTRVRISKTTHEMPTHTPTPPKPATMVVAGATTEVTRSNFEFEPNRADFKGGPARTSRVYLKAGEYGDNAAEYPVDENVVVPSTTTTTQEPSTATTATAMIMPEARQSGNKTEPKLRSCAATTRLQLLFVYVTILLYTILL